MEIGIRKFLAPMVDGITLDAGTTVMSGFSRIGLTVKRSNGEKPIRWLQRGTRLVALDNVLLGVSYDDLDANGLVQGVPLVFPVDGLDYRCRLLRVGETNKQRNEWEEFFAGISDHLTWEMDGEYSWGLDTLENGLAAVRRGCGMAHWTSFSKESRLPLVGWRPLLEPIFPPLDELPVGFCIQVWGKGIGDRDIAVEGSVLQVTAYDLLLRVDLLPNARLPWWQSVAPGVIAVDRSAIIRISVE